MSGYLPFNARRMVAQMRPASQHWFDPVNQCHLILFDGRIIGASAHTENAAWRDAAMVVRKENKL